MKIDLCLLVFFLPSKQCNVHLNASIRCSGSTLVPLGTHSKMMTTSVQNNVNIRGLTILLNTNLIFLNMQEAEHNLTIFNGCNIALMPQVRNPHGEHPR